MGNTFGRAFRVTTFGESHGHSLGCVVDGCPSKLHLTTELIQKELNRRKPNQSDLTTPRQETDVCEIISGVENNQTLGTPITIIIKNKDTKPKDYETTHSLLRPSHADYTTLKKYGTAPCSGGGRASARETVARVAAGVIAKIYVLSRHPNVEVHSWVERVYNLSQPITLENFSPEAINFTQIEQSAVRCPHPETSEQMIKLIQTMKDQGNSVGGAITGTILNLPAGLGEPVFDKAEAILAHALLSLPASKSFEIGSGLSGTFQTGLEHNDEFFCDLEDIKTRTNRSGGIQGGITNGMPVVFRVGFKPVSTIFKPQTTINPVTRETISFQPIGRHDPCVLPRAVPIVDAMVWLTLAELLKHHEAN